MRVSAYDPLIVEWHARSFWTTFRDMLVSLNEIKIAYVVDIESLSFPMCSRIILIIIIYLYIIINIVNYY